MWSRKRFDHAFAVSCVLATSVPALARAAELVAQVPEGCPDARELTFRIERRLGVPLQQAAPLRFDVTIERSPSGHRARIEVTPGGLRRDLVGSDCDRLTDSVSVALALALASASAEPTDVPAPTDGAAPTEAVAPEASGADKPAPPPIAEPPTRAVDAAELARAHEDAGLGTSLERSGAFPEPSLSLWAVGDAGSLPAPALGVGVGAELRWRRFELHVLATLFFEQEAEVESTSLMPPGAKLELWTGSALGCTLPWGGERTALTPLACLGVEVGRLAGEGTGVSAPRSGGAFWVAPLAQLGAVWAISESTLRLWLMLTGAAPLNRDEFTLRDVGPVHQPPPWIGRLSIGAGFDLN